MTLLGSDRHLPLQEPRECTLMRRTFRAPRTPSWTSSSTVRFRSFAGREGALSLAGSAALSGDVLRLTRAISSRSGSAWLNGKLALKLGFTARFAFEMSVPPGTGADGITFVIQSASAAASGSEIGTGNGLAVLLGSYQNCGEASARRFSAHAIAATQ